MGKAQFGNGDVGHVVGRQALKSAIWQLRAIGPAGVNIFSATEFLLLPLRGHM